MEPVPRGSWLRPRRGWESWWDPEGTWRDAQRQVEVASERSVKRSVCASAWRRRGFHPTIGGHHRARLAPARNGGKNPWWGIDVGTLAPQPLFSLVRETAASWLQDFGMICGTCDRNRMESRTWKPDPMFTRSGGIFGNRAKSRTPVYLVEFSANDAQRRQKCRYTGAGDRFEYVKCINCAWLL